MNIERLAMSTDSGARIPLDVLEGRKNFSYCLLVFGASIGAFCKVVITHRLTASYVAKQTFPLMFCKSLENHCALPKDWHGEQN